MPSASAFMKKFPSVTKVNTNCLIDMACPKCGSRGRFDIDCSTIATFSDDGEEATHDLEYGDEATCSCNSCHHSGTVKEFTFDDLDDEICKKIGGEDAED